MSKVLLVNGCSMTEGAELGNDLFDYDEGKYGISSTREVGMSDDHIKWMNAYSFGGLVGNALGIEVINIAKGGSSNSRIVRTTIEKVEELLLTKDSSDINVLLGFTASQRFEFFDGLTFRPCLPGHNTPKHFKNAGKYFVEKAKLIEPFVYRFYLMLMEIICIKSYLQSKNIKFLLTFGFASNFTYELESSVMLTELEFYPEIKHIFNAIEYNKNFWMKPKIDSFDSIEEFFTESHLNSFFFYCDDRNKYPIGRGHHPLEAAHQFWADTLVEYITKEKIYEEDH